MLLARELPDIDLNQRDGISTLNGCRMSLNRKKIGRTFLLVRPRLPLGGDWLALTFPWYQPAFGHAH